MVELPLNQKHLNNLSRMFALIDEYDDKANILWIPYLIKPELLDWFKEYNYEPALFANLGTIIQFKVVEVKRFKTMILSPNFGRNAFWRMPTDVAILFKLTWY